MLVIRFLAAALLSVGLVAAQTGKLGDAAVVSDNPVGAVYVATLPEKPNSTVRGSISASANHDGVGVTFNVDFWGFPQAGGPFMYHIHDQPVPANGNCTATLAHQDPYIRGEDPICDPSRPATCQVGDLSGKYGEISGLTPEQHWTQTYNDLYASTKPGLGSFFGNRSIVVHFKNKTRIACANFELKEPAKPCANSTTVLPTGTGGPVSPPIATYKPPSLPSPTPSPVVPPPPFEGGAVSTGVASVGVLFAAVLGLVFA